MTDLSEPSLTVGLVPRRRNTLFGRYWLNPFNLYRHAGRASFSNTNLLLAAVRYCMVLTY
ncbi:MAG: hypothetical protein QOH71_1378 [Blastocatellia bacterium]|nr:hypothetical protein [Blastocatellia bacterium]